MLWTSLVWLHVPCFEVHWILYDVTVCWLFCGRWCADLPFFLVTVGSWFVSPVLSGLMSVALFKLIRHFILLRPRPLVPGLRALPFFYGVTILVNVFSVVHDGPKRKCNFIIWHAHKTNTLIWMVSCLWFSQHITVGILPQCDVLLGRWVKCLKDCTAFSSGKALNMKAVLFLEYCNSSPIWQPWLWKRW